MRTRAALALVACLLALAARADDWPQFRGPNRDNDNTANTEGVDPHGPDWATTPDGEAAIGQWLAPHGSLHAVCDGHPCYMAGWNGP